MNMYADINDRLALFDKLKFFLHGKLPTITAGDLNCVLKKEVRAGSNELRVDVTGNLWKNLMTDFSL